MSLIEFYNRYIDEHDVANGTLLNELKNDMLFFLAKDESNRQLASLVLSDYDLLYEVVKSKYEITGCRCMISMNVIRKKR